MKVAISGASGLVGSALSAALRASGHEPRAMKRGATGTGIDLPALEGADAIVHLAGAGIADARWTAARKRELVDSRVSMTRKLVEAIRPLSSPPKILLSGSAVGVYGDRGDEVLTERSAIGRATDEGAGFLAGLCDQWEAASRPAEALGMRLVHLRTGVVLSAKGGALAKMLTPFRAGAGGPIGGGKQWMGWIAIDDVTGAIEHLLRTDSVRGPFNLTSPNPVTNADFTRTLGNVLHRPAIIPVPAFAARLAFGEVADAALLASQRALPEALQASGYEFRQPLLEAALRAAL
jgi:uncharacterized protein (TIGR01777 family)